MSCCCPAEARVYEKPYEQDAILYSLTTVRAGHPSDIDKCLSPAMNHFRYSSARQEDMLDVMV